MRESLVVSDPEPRLIVAGPARLLHLDNDRRGSMLVFRVPQRDGTAADCFTDPAQRPAITVPIAVPMNRAVDIAKDESMCVMVSRRASLSWHAERLTNATLSVARDSHASLP